MTAPAAPVAEQAQVNPIQTAIDTMRASLESGAQLAAPQEVIVPEATPIELVPGQDVQEQVEGEPKPEAEPEVVPEKTPEEIAAEEERVKALTVEIPEWRPGDAPLEIVVDSPEHAEQLRALINSRELKSESLERLQVANQKMAKVNEANAQWRVDPVGSAQKALDSEQQAVLALSILTDQRMLDYLRPTLEGILTSEDALQVTRSKLEAQRLRLAQDTQKAVQLEKAQERNSRDLQTAIGQITPPGTAAQRSQWRQDAWREVVEFADRTNVPIIDPRDLPMLLASRLRASNVDPRSAAEAIERKLFTRNAPDSAGSPSRPPAPAPAQPNRIIASAKVIAAASASAPAGAGAPTASVPPIPKGVGVKEAVKLFAKQAGVRVNP